VRTFLQFLEDRGFQPDACEATVEPDFYHLAERMHTALEHIADQDEATRLRTAYAKGHRARRTLK